MLYIIILLLVVVILLLAMVLFLFAKKTTYLCNKEKEFIIFVMDIFKEYGDDLGIQSKDQHEKLVEELEKIKKKHLK
jgi:sensor histidine kinase YesM